MAFIDFVKVEGGTFTMKEVDKKISLPDYYMGKYPVTQALYSHIMENNPSYFKGKNKPVEQVSWDDIHAEGGFLEKINANEDFKIAIAKNLQLKNPPDLVLRLPSEAEWEFAAQGGKLSNNYKYAGSEDIEEVAWYDSNTPDSTMPVGLKAPNELGIYDMSGNVWEWCADWYYEKKRRYTRRWKTQ